MVRKTKQNKPTKKKKKKKKKTEHFHLGDVLNLKAIPAEPIWCPVISQYPPLIC